MKLINILLIISLILLWNCEQTENNQKLSFSIQEANKIIDKQLMYEHLLFFNEAFFDSDEVFIYGDTKGLVDFKINFKYGLIITKEDTFKIDDVVNDYKNFAQKYNFYPKLFEQTPLNFQLYVTQDLPDFYEVDFGNERKYISKKDNRFQLFSLNEFLATFPISTNLESNALLKSYETKEKIKLLSNQNPIFKVLEIKGDFMKVETLNFCNSTNENDFEYQKGWIRFKKDGKLLIKQHFSC